MAPEILETVDQVMAALGGNQPVADLTGAKYNAVSMWRSARKFPANKYDAMIAALHERGKTAPASLWGQTPLRASLPEKVGERS